MKRLRQSACHSASDPHPLLAVSFRRDQHVEKYPDFGRPETGWRKDSRVLDLEGKIIEIVEVPDMHDRRYLFVPSLEAVFGGVLVDSGVHVWLADTATPQVRAAWVKALDGIIARAPKIVVPGHQTEGATQGLEAVSFTRDYLLAFEEKVAKSKDSGELIAAMTKRYPDLADASSLELSAKVAKGEMKWG